MNNMNYFLAKAEPEGDFSIDDLERVGIEPWTGVHNYQALQYIKSWQIGDKVFMYHSQKEKTIAGLMEVVSNPEKDLNDERGISWFANLKFVEKYPIEKRVTLKQIKDSGLFDDFLLVRNSRLSVLPCPIEFVNWINNTMVLNTV
jgi:predicted RNA-binding protein with PUA-like domain